MHPNPDWQTWATLAIGLLATAYLVRRWWPKGGDGEGAGGAGVASAGHCGTSSTRTNRPGASTAARSCGSCQGCGHSHAKADGRPSPDSAQPMVWHAGRRRPH